MGMIKPYLISSSTHPVAVKGLPNQLNMWQHACGQLITFIQAFLGGALLPRNYGHVRAYSSHHSSTKMHSMRFCRIQFKLKILQDLGWMVELRNVSNYIYIYSYILFNEYIYIYIIYGILHRDIYIYIHAYTHRYIYIYTYSSSEH